MKRIKGLLFGLCALLLITALPICRAADNTAAIDRKIRILKTVYKDGEYWNGQNGPNQTGRKKCACRTSCGNCACDCGAFTVDGWTYAWQCMGFACKMGYQLFGQNPYTDGWEKCYGTPDITVGDIVRYRATDKNGTPKGYDHAIFIYETDGDTVYFADCNRTGPCQVSWSGKTDRKTLLERLSLRLSGANSTGYVWHYTQNNYQPESHRPTHHSFTDVPEKAWYAEAVNYTYAAGIVNGVSTTLFDPDGLLTRAMFVRLLYNLGGTKASEAMPFTDVAPRDWFYESVRWAYQNGIVKGMSATRFAPDEPITREQMCVMLSNFASFIGCPLPQGTADFTDRALLHAWGRKAVGACQKAALISGMGGGRFAPNDTATRAQAAKLFMEFDRKIIP